jgi:hypothetical protein
VTDEQRAKTAPLLPTEVVSRVVMQAHDGKRRLPASTVFTETEIETLEALGPTLEGNIERQKNSHRARSQARAGWIVARVGGWNCYYKPPGSINFRRGMEQFHAIHRGWLLPSQLE